MAGKSKWVVVGGAAAFALSPIAVYASTTFTDPHLDDSGIVLDVNQRSGDVRPAGGDQAAGNKTAREKAAARKAAAEKAAEKKAAAEKAAKKKAAAEKAADREKTVDRSQSNSGKDAGSYDTPPTYVTPSTPSTPETPRTPKSPDTPD